MHNYDYSSTRKQIPPRPQTKLSHTENKVYPNQPLASQGSLSSLNANLSLNRRRSNDYYNNTERNLDPSPDNYYRQDNTYQNGLSPNSNNLAALLRPNVPFYYGTSGSGNPSQNNITLPADFSGYGMPPAMQSNNSSNMGQYNPQSSSGQSFYQPRHVSVPNPNNTSLLANVPPSYAQQSNPPNTNSNNPSSKSNSCAQLEIAGDLLKVLRDENKNLKEQNNYLLNKLRSLSDKDKLAKESIAKYEATIKQLTTQNQQLKTQVVELTAIAKHKVDEFGDKLSLLLVDQEAPANAKSPAEALIKRNQEHSGTQLNRILGWGQNQNHKARDSSETTGEATNESQLQELNNQFQALLYSCRVQKDPETRKDIRKKLVQLTYRMRQLRDLVGLSSPIQTTLR